MEKRYRALRIISTLYKILGGIVLVVSIVLALAVCVMGVLGNTMMRDLSNQVSPELAGAGVIVGILGGFAMLISGLLGGLSLLAAGEAIKLQIDIEENTRATARMLADHLRALAAPPAAAPIPTQSYPPAPPAV